jgi:hypothetical protein
MAVLIAAPLVDAIEEWKDAAARLGRPGGSARGDGEEGQGVAP